ncbi:hypothetical protein GsuE55_35300 [Geobacillus subterraneus]|uniref:Uncharacterized protein n=1 Tax=Geobacillus subterraneus TaxID=129338 RepID=A0A679FX60_9BACL|nr:hypothetical protein GsuE55_35300 [Geobacillus subterraneus]
MAEGVGINKRGADRKGDLPLKKDRAYRVVRGAASAYIAVREGQTEKAISPSKQTEHIVWQGSS